MPSKKIREKEIVKSPDPVTLPDSGSAADHVSRAAGRQHDPDPKTVEAIGANLRDIKGTVFDTSLHEAGADGKPTLRQNGEFKKKRGHGSKGKAAEAGKASQSGASSVYTPGKANAEQESAQARSAELDREARTNAIMVVGLVTGTMANMLGEEWLPANSAERPELQMLEDSTAKAFAAWGVTDIPPGWAICIAWGQYALPRLIVERRKPRWQRAWDKMFKKKEKPVKDQRHNVPPDPKKESPGESDEIPPAA